ncbi:MAG: hypothetical protein HC893_04160 [Chloroflexaceae bacterium]|nr:hypothetical protein [Chloroflexaceae bacterium]NJL33181.1 hypothetical protein [Chloroflexaceae bacterium]NJO06755.1 hypothetical protein [Chloroflexaceae bacterium]NJO85183.1 hypothetical protein [Blastochloris sp.]
MHWLHSRLNLWLVARPLDLLPTWRLILSAGSVGVITVLLLLVRDSISAPTPGYQPVRYGQSD